MTFRGNTINGPISTPYLLAINLHHAAVDHKKHCDMGCNVSLSRLEQAAHVVVEQASEIEKRDFDEWEWPS